LGACLTSGPLTSFMNWVRIQDEQKLSLIHMKQQFEYPATTTTSTTITSAAALHTHQSDHNHISATNQSLSSLSSTQFDTMRTLFGDNVCIKGTEGEKLVLNLEDNMRDNEHFAIIHGMNPLLNGSNLEDYIREWFPNENDRKECKVGLVGLWSDSLLYFLSYELRTRYGFEELATSSILTASPSRMQHYNSMQQLNRLFQVHIFDSIKPFQDWLIEDSIQLQNIASPDELVCGLHISAVGNATFEVSPMLRQVFCYMYRGSSRVEVEPLDGGFSEAAVYRCKSWDRFGHEQVTTVLKVNSIKKISTERTNFERVESILGNRAPQVLDYVELPDGETASIKFSYASMSGEESKTFYSMYMDSNVSQETINYILHETFVVALGKFYRVSSFEKHTNLFSLYDFDGKGWAWKEGGSDTPSEVKKRIHDILGCDPELSVLRFPNGYEFSNVALFLQYKLDDIRKNAHRIKDCVFMSYVHGDANGRNILVDHNNNVFLIDFEYTKYDHMLKDVTKIENDVLYEYTTLDSEEEFKEAMRITNELLHVEDLGLPLQQDIGLKTPKLIRAWETVRCLREIVAELVTMDRSPFQMDVVLLRYALQSMTMQYPRYNRMWALAGACGFSRRIEDRAARNTSLYVKWMTKQIGDPVQIGITLLPGREDKGADLAGDLITLKSQNVSTLVVLCTFQELKEHLAPGANIEDECKKVGLNFRFFPITDHSTPTLHHTLQITAAISSDLDKGSGNICLSSIAGLGRCGVIASCLLMYRNLKMAPLEAKTLVREARGHRSIENETQNRFVDSFHKYLHLQPETQPKAPPSKDLH